MATSKEDFVGILGTLIVSWNHAEALLNGLLSCLTGGGTQIAILTAHMNTVAVCDALRTLANDGLTDEELAPHVLHYVEFFERLRAYRNYYVHGIKAVGFTDGEAFGLAETVSAKHRFTLHQLKLTAADLTPTVTLIIGLVAYGSKIIAHLLWTRDKSLPIPEHQRSLQSKPPLPDELKKPRLLLLDWSPGTGKSPT